MRRISNKIQSGRASTPSAHRRHRRLLFEKFESRRLLAIANDDVRSIQANTVLESSGWTNDTYNPDSWEEEGPGCVQWNGDYYDGTWGYGYVDGVEVYGYWDVNGNYHEEGVPEEFHPAGTECIEYGTVLNTVYTHGSIISGPSYGTLTYSTQGAESFGYEPFHNFVGTDSITYEIIDNNGSATATITINVTSLGGPAPDASDDTYSAGQDTPLTIPPAGLLANDTDDGSTPLTASLVVAPSHGSITINSDGSFTYVPDLYYSGWDSFIYEASDGHLSDEGLVSINVNASPAAWNDVYLAAQDAPLSIGAPGLLANDQDSNNDPLTAELALSLAHGTVVVLPGGGFIYTPSPGYTGPDTFTYRARDPFSYSQVQHVNLTVLPIDSNMIPQDDAWTTPANTPLVVDPSGVLANDSGGSGLTAVVGNGPASGSLNLAGSGGLTYTPPVGSPGTESFTYWFTNGIAASPVANVAIANYGGSDIALTNFYSDDTNLKVQYLVYGPDIGPFDIAIYASFDGVTPGPLLQQPELDEADRTQGMHTLVIEPTFIDLQQDYYLLAKVDIDDAVDEVNEDNNYAPFQAGIFVATEPGGKRVLHVHGTDWDEPIAAASSTGCFSRCRGASKRLLTPWPQRPAAALSRIWTSPATTWSAAWTPWPSSTTSRVCQRAGRTLPLIRTPDSMSMATKR